MPASPQPPSKEDVVAEFRRRSIIEAACHVFGENGFELATVDAIAEAAGMAKGTVYLYYPSKQAIYDAVFASGMADIEHLIGERLGQAGSAREAIAAFVTVRSDTSSSTPISSGCMSPRSRGRWRCRRNRAVPASSRSTGRRARSRE